MMHAKSTLFFDVDTQRDFILPDGKLSVPGTDRIIANLAAVTNLARRLGIKIVASTDHHFPNDPELQRNGGEFVDHCMDGTAGQKKIDETTPLNPLFIANRELSASELTAAVAHAGEIVLEKQLFDVFAGNRNAEALLRRLLVDYQDVVVYGVYTEICVRDAIKGLRELGARLHIVEDAIADIGAEGAAHRARWRADGIEFLSVQQLSDQLERSESRH
jgi:nicotinamidase/pyrazinamidase